MLPSRCAQQELTFLAHLPALKALGLQDSQSVANPVCLLCNYSTHVLYHMPGLQRLDSYNVSSRNMKEAAEVSSDLPLVSLSLSHCLSVSVSLSLCQFIYNIYNVINYSHISIVSNMKQSIVRFIKRANRHEAVSYKVLLFLEKSFNINLPSPQTTVMKKMMYYNMRVHTAEKNLRETGQRLMEQKEALWKPPVEQLRACSHAIKDVCSSSWNCGALSFQTKCSASI